MTETTLNCNKCGAPVVYDGRDVTTIQCPFCNSTIIIPVALRPRKEPVVDTIVVSQGNHSGAVILAVIAVVLVMIGALVSIFAFTGGSEDSIQESEVILPTEYIPPTETPEPSPTPAYAALAVSFGQEGMNPGQMQNARNIAIAGDKWILTAEYDSARVQVFDLTGQFIRQWKTPNEKSSIQGLAADRAGRAFVSTDGAIYVYDIESGRQLMEWRSAAGGEYGDLAVTPEGNLAAIWYEGRWGIITSLEGHSEALDVYSPEGKVVQHIASPISGLTEELALEVCIAINGNGTIYLMESGRIYVYSAEGVYQNKFAIYGLDGKELYTRSNLAVDGQGNLYIADSNQVILLDENGHAVKSYPTEAGADYLAVDSKDNVWAVSSTRVDEYVKTGY